MQMKIELQLSARQLNTLVYALSYLDKTVSKTRSEKVMRSILIETAIKIEKKNVELKRTLNTLFGTPKKTKFTFKHYEADAIEKFLMIVHNYPLNEYDKMAVLFIINKLNQQMA
jgi:hypothetical protein